MKQAGGRRPSSQPSLSQINFIAAQLFLTIEQRSGYDRDEDFDRIKRGSTRTCREGDLRLRKESLEAGASSGNRLPLKLSQLSYETYVEKNQLWIFVACESIRRWRLGGFPRESLPRSNKTHIAWRLRRQFGKRPLKVYPK